MRCEIPNILPQLANWNAKLQLGVVNQRARSVCVETV